MPLEAPQVAGDVARLWTCAGRVRRGEDMYGALVKLLC